MTDNFAFLKSNRFWVLVLTGLIVAVEGSFTAESILKGLTVIFTGFIGIRTVDRIGDKLVAK